MATSGAGNPANDTVPNAIPIVDIAPFTSGGSVEAQQQAARELATKASVNGCVGISGHGVSPELLSEAFAMTKKLFDLPYNDKMKAPHPDGPVPHRGYSGTGRENAARKTEKENWDGTAQKKDYEKFTDNKESYEMGSEENTVNYNIWLPEEVFPGFKSWGLRFYWELHKTAMVILEALMMSLELRDSEKESIRKLHTGHDNQLRLLHYPPLREARLKNEHVSRLGAHTDWRYVLDFRECSGGLGLKVRLTMTN